MAAYQDLGRKLRDRRLERRIELHDIAQSLHIRQFYLESLEEGMLEQLPGDVFVHGYLNRYAWYLGLDPEDLLDEYRAIGTLPQGRLRYIPDSMREQHHPGWHVVLITVCMAAVLLLSWSAGRVREEELTKVTALAAPHVVRPAAAPVDASLCLKGEAALWPPCYYADLPMRKQPRGVMELQ